MRMPSRPSFKGGLREYLLRKEVLLGRVAAGVLTVERGTVRLLGFYKRPIYIYIYIYLVWRIWPYCEN